MKSLPYRASMIVEKKSWNATPLAFRTRSSNATRYCHLWIGCIAIIASSSPYSTSSGALHPCWLPLAFHSVTLSRGIVAIFSLQCRVAGSVGSQHLRIVVRHNSGRFDSHRADRGLIVERRTLELCNVVALVGFSPLRATKLPYPSINERVKYLHSRAPRRIPRSA